METEKGPEPQGLEEDPVFLQFKRAMAPMGNPQDIMETPCSVRMTLLLTFCFLVCLMYWLDDVVAAVGSKTNRLAAKRRQYEQSVQAEIFRHMGAAADCSLGLL
jgi:hypothetical protein